MLLSFVRTLVLYVLLLVAVRLLGKRQIGEMEPTEFVVALLIADLAAIPMQDGAIPLLSGVIPMATVLGCELILAGACMRWVGLRRMLCGKPVILIENGRVLRENLRSTRITLDELSEQLRQNNVLSPETVQYAILETNGKLSVFLFPKFAPASAKDAGITPGKQSLPYTIIADGYLYRENLRLAGKDEAWLNKVLTEKESRRQDIFLLTVDKKDRILCITREEAK